MNDLQSMLAVAGALGDEIAGDDEVGGPGWEYVGEDEVGAKFFRKLGRVAKKVGKVAALTAIPVVGPGLAIHSLAKRKAARRPAPRAAPRPVQRPVTVVPLPRPASAPLPLPVPVTATPAPNALPPPEAAYPPDEWEDAEYEEWEESEYDDEVGATLLGIEDINRLSPAGQAALLMRLAGTSPDVDALILKLKLAADSPAKAAKLVSSPKAAEKVHKRAKKVVALMEKGVKASIEGFSLDGDYVGFIPGLGSVLSAVAPKVVKAAGGLLGKAFGGDKKAKAKVQEIKKKADSGDATAKEGLKVLKQADELRRAAMGPQYQMPPASTDNGKLLVSFFDGLMQRGYTLKPPEAVHVPPAPPAPAMPPYPFAYPALPPPAPVAQPRRVDTTSVFRLGAD